MSLDKRILAIALPAIVSNITVPMLGLVDTAIMGHLGAAAFIGAIAVGSTMFNMVYWLFGFLRMGTAGLTAQAFGARDDDASAATLWRSLLIAMAAGSLLIALAAPVGDAAVRFLDAGDDVSPLAVRYFNIAVWGAPAVLVTYTFNGWFLGMQNTRVPMWIAIGCNIINIILSTVFVFIFDMEIAGVATGTLLAQWIGALAALVVLPRRYRLRHVSFRSIADCKALKRLTGINADIFLRTLCLVGVTVWFTRTGASQGVIVLSANALLMQLFMFFSYFCDGFAYSGEALAGDAAGRRDIGALGRVRRRIMKWTAGIALAFAVAYFLGGDFILSLLTDRREVTDVAREYLAWAAAVPLCGAAAFIYDGIFIGITRTRPMLWSVFVSAALFFGVIVGCGDRLTNHCLWLAFILYLVARGVFLHFSFRRFVKDRQIS